MAKSGFNANKSKIIILLTDGQNNVGISPDTAVEYAKQNDVTIHAIGVATKEGGKISNLNFTSQLDEELLKQMAQETSGRFFVVENSQNLSDAFKQIASSSEKSLPINISWILLMSGIALLGLEWMLINTIYKTIP